MDESVRQAMLQLQGAKLVNALRELALASLEQGDFDQARKCIEAAIAQNEDPELHDVLEQQKSEIRRKKYMLQESGRKVSRSGEQRKVDVPEELLEFFASLWDEICSDRAAVLSRVDDLIQADLVDSGAICGGYNPKKEAFEFRYDPRDSKVYWRFAIAERQIAAFSNRNASHLEVEEFKKAD